MRKSISFMMTVLNACEENLLLYLGRPANWLLMNLCILASRISKGIGMNTLPSYTCKSICRTTKEKNKTSGKFTDRSISPLPNPPSGQPMKLSNKLTGPLRSQSPSQAGRPPKKKKKDLLTLQY